MEGECLFFMQRIPSGICTMGGLIHQTREPTRILLLLIIDKCNPMMKTERLSVTF